MANVVLVDVNPDLKKYMVNIILADALAMDVGRASAIIILIQTSRIYPGHAWQGLSLTGHII